MSFRDFYEAYKARTPAFLQAVIRPFWLAMRAIYYFLRPHFTWTRCAKMSVGWKRAGFVRREFDYVRHSSLELVAREIYENNVQGSVAELGVHRGDFAKYINLMFPDRKLYLFDTFEGFNPGEVEMERARKNYVPMRGSFENTSEDIVLSKMKYRDNCVVKKGFFPETAAGLEDVFAFVNIDVDLSEPIYNGLCWFYPRLGGGGVHFCS